MEHEGLVLWFTGLPCSGKTTVADKVAEKMKAKDMKVERLDGDIVRKSLTRDLGFSKEDRDKNIERVTFVAMILSRNGVAVLPAFVSPYIGARDNARKECTNFIEVFVKCSVEECEKRDVKGMYKKAREGIIKDFTGVDDPYEEPPNPEIVLETDKETLDESAQKVVEYLKGRGYYKE
jgi:adenylyl-sulfate kinase